MPANPETLLYKRLKDNLPDCLITRIESRVNLGIPDCLIAFRKDRMFVMVELKVVKSGKKIRMSPHQIAFHLKHAELGCPTYFLVEHNKHISKGPSEILLYEGWQAEDLMMLGTDTPPLGRWLKKGVQWHIVRHLLTGGEPVE